MSSSARIIATIATEEEWKHLHRLREEEELLLRTSMFASRAAQYEHGLATEAARSARESYAQRLIARYAAKMSFPEPLPEDSADA